jgi:predicted nucleic acid-binding protein
MEYFDTSVLVPFYCPEPHSLAADQALTNSPKPCISMLSEVEFMSAVSLKIRTGQLNLVDATAATSKFQSHITAGSYTFLQLRAEEFELARDWIARFSTPLRTLDALHLATAHLNRCELITADAGLAKSAAVFGVRFQRIT